MVRGALDDSHPSLCLVFERPQSKWHGTVLFGHGAEELARVFHLQHVGGIRFLVNCYFGVTVTALTDTKKLDIFTVSVNGTSSTAFPHLSFTGGHDDVHGVHLVQFEVVLFLILPLGLTGILDDRFLTVDTVLLQLQNSSCACTGSRNKKVSAFSQNTGLR